MSSSVCIECPDQRVCGAKQRMNPWSVSTQERRIKTGTDGKPGAVPRPDRDTWTNKKGMHRLETVWDRHKAPNSNHGAKSAQVIPHRKPIALLERIIEASSNEGDIVFDPFCGCATTLVAADRHGAAVGWHRLVAAGCEIGQRAHQRRSRRVMGRR